MFFQTYFMFIFKILTPRARNELFCKKKNLKSPNFDAIGWSKISWKMTLGKHFELNMADIKKIMKYKRNALNKLDK